MSSAHRFTRSAIVRPMRDDLVSALGAGAESSVDEAFVATATALECTVRSLDEWPATVPATFDRFDVVVGDTSDDAAYASADLGSVFDNARDAGATVVARTTSAHQVSILDNAAVVSVEDECDPADSGLAEAERFTRALALRHRAFDGQVWLRSLGLRGAVATVGNRSLVVGGMTSGTRHLPPMCSWQSWCSSFIGAVAAGIAQGQGLEKVLSTAGTAASTAAAWSSRTGHESLLASGPSGASSSWS